MRRSSLLLPLVATASLMLAPSVEAKEEKHPTLSQKYTRLYFAVKHRHGTRAPGRNIRRHGVRYDAKANNRRGPWKVRPATKHEIAKSIRQLRTLLAPPRPLLVRRAVPPSRPPSGVMSTAQHAPAGGVLDRIASCESGGNPRAVNPNGHYGKYQFDYGTWNSVGGSGNPAAASEAEQDKRAAMLYARRGSAPWACKP
jgi:hypothetical protein